MASGFQGTKINPTRFHRSQLKFYAVLVPIAAFMTLPILFLVCNAFKPMDELFAYPPAFIVKNPTLLNFKKLLLAASSTGIPPTRYIFNSILLSASVVLLTMVFSVSAGYALSKKRFRVKNAFFEINTLALMFVPVAVEIPRYLLMVSMGLIDNFLSNILPLVAMPVGLFLVKQFIDQIPDSLIEAAKIDGATDVYILRKVIVPLVRPALATVAILSFQAAWSSVEASQFYINNESLKSFAYYMSTFISVGDAEAGMTSSSNIVAGMGISAASGLIMFLPNLFIFIFMQSKVMSTMAYSGIK